MIVNINIIKLPLKKLFHFFLMIRDTLYCKITIGYYRKSWRFWGLPVLSKHKDSTISIGENFVACSLSKYNSIGVFQKVIIKTVEKNSKIVIGNNVGISGCTISSSKFISIGDTTLIGSGVLITDSDAHPLQPNQRRKSQFTNKAPIIIENNVFIGARSIILKGVTIGEGSVIGAGSVVTSNIPKLCIAAGNPARIIKKT